ncbi:MAG: sugar phosphate nucleotidyltransferase [Actinomycetota bacterium]|nr:sugar phosphate nucleotidyltransferase [Actinomycetota bacterium]
MKAVIMAGGEGSRLRPLTSNVPKPMVPIVNRPLMEHVVTHLRRHGFSEIVVTVAYLANAIRTYFGDGSELGVRMVYATEEAPLGTAGSVRNARDVLDETFVVISGDVLTDIDLTAIVARHREREAMATIGLVRVEDPLEFGIVICDEDGRVERFLEKPTWGEVFSDTINSGVFVLEPEVLEWIPPDRPVDFSGEVFPRLLDAGRPIAGAVSAGYWEDIGTLEAYVRAHRDVLDGRVDVDIGGFPVADGVWLGRGSQIDPDALVEGPAVVGDNCRVGPGARLGGYTVLGANVRIGRDVDLERVVVGEGAYVGEAARLRGAVIGRGCDLRRQVRCEEGAALGEGCLVGEDAFIGTGVKVYPQKTIEAGATITSSIVWESRGARSPFTRDGVVGMANVDVTPELAVRVAMAYGTTLDVDALVAVSRDSSRSARMLKRAVIAGLNSAGVNVVDLEVASIPVTRYQVGRTALVGGVTVRIAERDPQRVVIRFLDADGADLPETARRRVERSFNREDYRRVLPGEIGDILVPPGARGQYAAALEATVDLERIRRRRFRLVVDYSCGSTSIVMPNVLGKVGAEVLAVNPYASTPRMLAAEPAALAADVARLVEASSADAGAVIGVDGERLTLVDDRGRVLDDVEALLAYVSLLGDRLTGQQVAVPVAAPTAVRRLANDVGAAVRETRMSTAAVSEAAAGAGVAFAADLAGGFVVPAFLPAFDGAAALLLLLDLLAERDRSLSAVVDALPRTHRATESVATPWERTGAVMRELVAGAPGDTVLVDGVKLLIDDGWTLAVPDPTGPVTRVWAEGPTATEAQRRARELAGRIRRLVG